MRNKLIELMTQHCPLEDCTRRAVVNCFECMTNHLLANGVTIQRWIPVSERLPDNKESVYVATDDGYVCVAYYYLPYEQWFDEAGNPFLIGRHYITHWMPLPEPPKGE